MYQASLIAEDRVASYEHLVGHCLSEDFHLEHISQDFFCFLLAKGMVLSPEPAGQGNPGPSMPRTTPGLGSLSPSFLCYVVAYGSFTQRKEGIWLGAESRPAREPLVCVNALSRQAGLQITVSLLTHTQKFNCQSSLLVLAAGRDVTISLILKD